LYALGLDIFLKIADDGLDRLVVLIDVADDNLLKLANEFLSLDGFHGSADDKVAKPVCHEKRDTRNGEFITHERDTAHKTFKM